MAAKGKGPIRAGIIGQGRSGLGIHANWFTKSPRKYKIVAVTDILKDRRERAVSEFGCEAYSDYHEMLQRDDLDLVVNSLPSHLHPQGSIDALKAGHNVVCEKPLAPNMRDFRRVRAAAKRSGKVLAPYQQSRNAPYFTQVQKVIASGVLGRIVMIKVYCNGFARRWDWQTLQEFGAGSLLNTGPHPVDQALCLLDWKKPEVHCLMDRANVAGDAEDHVKVIMTRKGMPTIDLEISSCCAYPGDMYQVYGTQGGLSGGASGLRWRYFKPKEAPKLKLIRTPLPGPSYCREHLKYYERTWEPSKAQRNGFTYMSKLFYDHLYKVLRDGAPLQMTLEQVAVQVAVMEECHRQCSLSRKPARGWPKGN